MKNIHNKIILPKTAIVVFNHGAFGGAAKRYTQLYIELNRNYPANFFLFVNNHLYSQITGIFPGIDTKNIRIVDLRPAPDNKDHTDKKTTHYADHQPDPVKIDESASYIRKIYWYFKNKRRQKKIFDIIEGHRKKLDIKVMVGVFGGGIPLVFYTDENPRRASVVFANMDSWFSDVHPDMKKLWYRRFYSFNEIMEKADIVDFLSPYILEGIKKSNVNINDDSFTVAPCSFIDYSKCIVGDKSTFEIAFSARLEPDKNPLLFLEAVTIIHERHPEIKFHLLGEGSLVHEIENYIKENNLEDIINFRFHKNPPEVFANTSIFISLQTGTNYPSQSVLEAMACGNAIIASNVGDTNLFINENTGVTIPLNTTELVNAIEKMINDKSKTHAIGLSAREYVMKNHTSEKYIEYFLGLVNKAYNKNFKQA